MNEGEILMIAITLTTASNLLNDQDDPNSMAVNLIVCAAIQQLEDHLSPANVNLRRKEIRI